jgi:hypothetical protein
MTPIIEKFLIEPRPKTFFAFGHSLITNIAGLAVKVAFPISDDFTVAATNFALHCRFLSVS